MRITDSERLDALERYGLCVTMHSVFVVGEWVDTWVCCYGMKTIAASTIREVIDAAILDLTTINNECH